MSISAFKKSRIGLFVWKIYMCVKRPIILINYRNKLNEIVNIINSTNKHIYYCGICETSNMGDLAQTYCIRKWLGENYREYEVVEIPTTLIMDYGSTISTIKKYVNNNDLFFFQSGYNTHDLGGKEDLMHQMIMQSFPENPMVMMPQTVYFKTAERKEKCSRVYNGHKKLLFFARDYQSLAFAEEMFPDIDVKFLPDIVSSLIGRVTISEHGRDGIFLCRRYDIEQFYTEDEYKRIVEILSELESVVVEDTIISVRNSEITKDIKKYIDEMISTFAKYRVVVTDKFHGLIFSLIAETPVVVLRTKDHKVTGGYNLFHEAYPDYVYFADSYDEIKEKVKFILDNRIQHKLEPYYYEKYYRNLRDVIESWKAEISE